MTLDEAIEGRLDRWRALPWVDRAWILLTPRRMWPRRTVLAWRKLGDRRDQP